MLQTGDKNSSHSSSNTLSSNASSNSDDKHFGSGDLMDPEMLGLTYIKGASTDSGIDTNPCMAPGARVLLQGRMGEQGNPWVSEQHEDRASEEDHGKLYLPQGYASAILSSRGTEGSIGDLSEISSHSRYWVKTAVFISLSSCVASFRQNVFASNSLSFWFKPEPTHVIG